MLEHFHLGGEITLGAHETVGIVTDDVHPQVPAGKTYIVEYVSVAIALPGTQWPRVRLFEQYENETLGFGHHLVMSRQGDFGEANILTRAYYVFSGPVRMYLRAGSTLACRFVRDTGPREPDAERDCTCIFTAEGKVVEA